MEKIDYNKFSQESDDTNPEFVFATTDCDTLARMLSGELDPRVMIAQQLTNCGCDLNGKYVGFKKAEQIFKESK